MSSPQERRPNGGTPREIPRRGIHVIGSNASCSCARVRKASGWIAFPADPLSSSLVVFSPYWMDRGRSIAPCAVPHYSDVNWTRVLRRLLELNRSGVKSLLLVLRPRSGRGGSQHHPRVSEIKGGKGATVPYGVSCAGRYAGCRKTN